MKPWLRRTLFGVAGLSVLAAAFAAGACRGHYGHHGWRQISDADAARLQERFVDKASRKLDLDEAQKAHLTALAERVREQRRAFVGSGGGPRSELAALFAGPAFDRAKAQSLLEAKTAAMTSGGPALIAALGDFYDSLRPEQQDRLRALIDRGRHGWHG